MGYRVGRPGEIAGRKILIPWDRPGFAATTVAPGELGPGRATTRAERRDRQREVLRARCLFTITGTPPNRHVDDVLYDRFFRMGIRNLLSIVHRKNHRDTHTLGRLR